MKYKLNNLKYISLLMCLFIALFGFVGCATDSPKEEYSLPAGMDIKDLANHLYNSFEPNSMESIELSLMESIYGFDNASLANGLIMMSIAAKADELAIFETTQSTDVAALCEALATHLDDQINIFKDYAPEEVEKLKNSSIIKQYGQYVVLCISDDMVRSQTVIDEFFDNANSNQED